MCASATFRTLGVWTRITASSTPREQISTARYEHSLVTQSYGGQSSCARGSRVRDPHRSCLTCRHDASGTSGVRGALFGARRQDRLRRQNT